jgi:hypothetical protein
MDRVSLKAILFILGVPFAVRRSARTNLEDVRIKFELPGTLYSLSAKDGKTAWIFPQVTLNLDGYLLRTGDRRGRTTLSVLRPSRGKKRLCGGLARIGGLDLRWCDRRASRILVHDASFRLKRKRRIFPDSLCFRLSGD